MKNRYPEISYTKQHVFFLGDISMTRIRATTVLTHHQLGTGNGPQSSYLVLLCPYHVGGSMSRQAHQSVWINLQWPASPSSPNAERQTYPTFILGLDKQKISQ